MALKTVLEITQDILNDIDGDEVNSISDTVESLQIANIIRSTYEGMSANRNWPYQKKLSQLEGLSDTSRPSHMRIADDVKELFDISYDKRKDVSDKTLFLIVRYLEPDVFLVTLNSRDSKSDKIQTVIDTNGATLLIRNNIAPTFWTSFDDKDIVFDSFNNVMDTTLQKSKTQVLAFIEQPFVMADDAVPPIPSEAFPALIAEAKATAAFVINQIVNSKAEKNSRKQSSWLSQKVWKTRGGIKYNTGFGRKRVK